MQFPWNPTVYNKNIQTSCLNNTIRLTPSMKKALFTNVFTAVDENRTASLNTAYS